MLGWGLGTYFAALVLYVALVTTVPEVEAMNNALPFGSFLMVPAVVAGVAMGLVGVRRSRVLRQAIAESKARMADPVYRQRLRDLGVAVLGGPLPDVPVKHPNANHKGMAERMMQEQWMREFEQRGRPDPNAPPTSPNSTPPVDPDELQRIVNERFNLGSRLPDPPEL
jgi:hypothetical protein